MIKKILKNKNIVVGFILISTVCFLVLSKTKLDNSSVVILEAQYPADFSYESMSNSDAKISE